MATPRSTTRTRSSGGRALMLLGVLLAVLSGVLVIYIVSQATSTAGQTIQVVVAKQDIASGTLLTTGATNATTNVLNIQDAFVEQSYPTNLVPPNAFIFTNIDDLEVHLNNQVVVSQIYAGDVLHNSDPRLQAYGSGATGSLTGVKPDELKPGQVLLGVNVTNPAGNSRSFVVAGDHIDILATECSLPNTTGCVTQTTLQNVYVYAVFTSAVVVVLTHQQALELKYLIETGKVDVVLRDPADNNASPETTQPVTGAFISSQFSF
jgi:Flp pilus assembly protein CpaB